MGRPPTPWKILPPEPQPQEPRPPRGAATGPELHGNDHILHLLPVARATLGRGGRALPRPLTALARGEGVGSGSAGPAPSTALPGGPGCPLGTALGIQTSSEAGLTRQGQE